MMLMPIMPPALVGGAPPASFVFNGTDAYLRRPLTTSGASTSKFTYSLWAYVPSYTPFQPQPFFGTFAAEGGTDRGLYCDTSDSTFDFNSTVRQEENGDFFFSESGTVPTVPATGWHHFVIRFDSTQSSESNRIRQYLDNTLMTEIGFASPQNGSHMLFENGAFHWIGAHAEIGGFSPLYLAGKLAFIDVLEGVSVDPTAFAFNDGGTWTRKPFAGSHGAYGFSLDGSDGFNDVSGNGQHFTGVNMTPGSDLDPVDLPPFIVSRLGMWRGGMGPGEGISPDGGSRAIPPHL